MAIRIYVCSIANQSVAPSRSFVLPPTPLMVALTIHHPAVQMTLLWYSQTY
ncbi:hypothetical protein [Lactiplantibacillus plantarum]|uniref:hypothetical protein n=1 Tax=Lactiplantibacillus plantarum TaxID=1590 RepID=UPI00155AD751|nr:hypothetical protein [Lactiplantibacillus plantarum]